MTSEEVHAFLDRFRHAWEEADLESMSDCYADNCELVSPIYHTVRGREALENSYRDAFKTFASISVRADDTIIDSANGRVAAIWTMRSKHAAEIFGVAASGKSIEVNIAFVLTLENGRIAKEVRIYDFAKMLLELGVLRARA
jgi:steroid delta-isomerase-like uncharacterized protein